MPKSTNYSTIDTKSIYQICLEPSLVAVLGQEEERFAFIRLQREHSFSDVLVRTEREEGERDTPLRCLICRKCVKRLRFLVGTAVPDHFEASLHNFHFVCLYSTRRHWKYVAIVEQPSSMKSTLLNQWIFAIASSRWTTCIA